MSTARAPSGSREGDEAAHKLVHAAFEEQDRARGAQACPAQCFSVATPKVKCPAYTRRPACMYARTKNAALKEGLCKMRIQNKERLGDDGEAWRVVWAWGEAAAGKTALVDLLFTKRGRSALMVDGEGLIWHALKTSAHESLRSHEQGRRHFHSSIDRRRACRAHQSAGRGRVSHTAQAGSTREHFGLHSHGQLEGLCTHTVPCYAWELAAQA